MTDQSSDLVTRRDRLTEQFALAQAELGGIFYEMAIRDHVRLDVLTRKAAALQRVDEELAQVTALLQGEPGPAIDSCNACGTPHPAGVKFCGNCGAELQPAGAAA